MTSQLVFLPDAASKHAVMGFFDCLRAEVEEYDVVVSTVSPTFIRSYHINPEQRNWESSICRCKSSEDNPESAGGETQPLGLRSQAESTPKLQPADPGGAELDTHPAQQLFPDLTVTCGF